jgi:hypothetical protein
MKNSAAQENTEGDPEAQRKHNPKRRNDEPNSDPEPDD